jgi:hypothetical protein
VFVEASVSPSEVVKKAIWMSDAVRIGAPWWIGGTGEA